MESANKNRKSIETIVLGAILTAIVVVLQYLGSFIHFGPFSISLVLVPIVIGAATCSTKISTWLGFVFGVVVMMTGPAIPTLLTISAHGTIITVLLKGTACGLAAGVVYKLVSKKNTYLAVVMAAIVCPIVNTGIFLLGCVLFFFEHFEQQGLSLGYTNIFQYMFLGLAGGNFLFELATNILLSPIIVRILNIRKKQTKQ